MQTCACWAAMTRAARGRRRGRTPASRSSTTGGPPAREECEDHQHAREDGPQQDRREDRFRLALCERRGAAIRPVHTHGRGGPEGDEVRERGPAPWSWYAVLVITCDM